MGQNSCKIERSQRSIEENRCFRKKNGTFNTLSKKERLQVDRLRTKLEKNLGSIADMTRLPGALFIVDTMREHIAVKEAQRLNIPIFATVDTNCDPNPIDFVIPANGR